LVSKTPDSSNVSLIAVNLEIKLTNLADKEERKLENALGPKIHIKILNQSE
jgi:hypothetical protein